MAGRDLGGGYAPFEAGAYRYADVECVFLGLVAAFGGWILFWEIR